MGRSRYLTTTDTTPLLVLRTPAAGSFTFPALGGMEQEAQNGRPARPEEARPRSVLSVREDAERLRTPLAGFLSLLLSLLLVVDLV